jgi:hypothetical protein
MAIRSIRQDVNVCSLEYDEGQPRIRVWAWLSSSFGDFARSCADDQLDYLRRTLGHRRIWIDRHHQPAVDLPRSMDYIPFAEQRAREEARKQKDARDRLIRAETTRQGLATAEQIRQRREANRLAETHPIADEPTPENAVHVAGPRGKESEDQYCARCGALLRCGHSFGRPAWGAYRGGDYAPGELIERGNGWQAITFKADAPTCTPRAEQEPRTL